MKNTVIFDLDGTILNTLYDLGDSVNYALNEQGFPLRTYDEVRSFVGNGIKKLIERSVPETATSEQTEKCYKTFCDYYEKHLYVKTKAYDGVLELLATLKANGVKTAIVTNKADFAAQKLCSKVFGDLITVTVGAREGLHHKPSTDTTNLALNMLNSKPSEAVFVGDSDVDFFTAQNANIDFVGVLWGFRDRSNLEKAGATTFAENITELTNILLNQ